MGESGNVSSQFRRALDAGNFESARLLAFEVPRVSLEDAIELTLLAAKTKASVFEVMSRRWFSRLLEEVVLPLPTVAIVGQLLADVSEGDLAPSKALAPLQRAARGDRLG